MQEEKGTTENEMVGWHQQLDGHEFEQGPGVGDGLGSLTCCSPWGKNMLSERNYKTTERVKMIFSYLFIFFNVSRSSQKRSEVKLLSRV